jgi:HAD superfamily hydrolase (TIGR01509 family)
MSKCVIFDCDGTLVDSEYLCNLALEMNLAELGVQESAAKLIERYRGWKLAKIFNQLEDIHHIKLNESKYRGLVTELFDRELQPVDGVKKALSEIQQVKCVASSGPLEKINQALQITGLSEFFGSHIFSSYIVKSWKPDPGLFLYAAEAMNFKPEECAVVEDSKVGLIAAISAGMQAYFFNPENVECQIRSAVSFNDMSQLPSFFKD